MLFINSLRQWNSSQHACVPLCDLCVANTLNTRMCNSILFVSITSVLLIKCTYVVLSR